MDDQLAQLEARCGILLPPGYREWALRGYTDYRGNAERYLWLPDLKEWLRPEEIPDYDLWRTGIIPGLLAFGRNASGDNWCWNTQIRNGESEYDVLFCWHDEELADRFAPTFPAWFYRLCLDYACDIDTANDGLEQARSYLRLWSERLAEIYPSRWADHLRLLSEAQPFTYHDPRLRAHIKRIGLVTAMSVSDIVAIEFGSQYVDGKVRWSAEEDVAANSPDEFNTKAPVRPEWEELNQGPPCPNCGTALRTPKAKQCFRCGANWHDQPRSD